jgi:transcriptional regulator NrdR family protein
MKVVKRDGSVEEYNERKVERVVTASGLTPAQGKLLAKAVTLWVNENNGDQISSLRIRDKVIVELQKVDKGAADFFIWYEKKKDKGNV